MTPVTTWSVAGEEIDLGSGALVGILNVTPDSFSDGGEFLDPDLAVARGLKMVELGATLVDVGGESTRPGATPVAEDEELRRVLPVVERLVAAGVKVSIDTYKPAVVRASLGSGATVVNDVTGFRDPAMVAAVADSQCGVVTVHMRGRPLDMHVEPEYDDVLEEVEAQLLSSVDRLESGGVEPSRIVVDPGIGFGKRAHHSLAVLAGIDRLAGHGYPVMVGTSRKGFLAKTTGGETTDRRDLATAITTALAYVRGARLFRVHDVVKSGDAMRMAAAIVAP